MLLGAQTAGFIGFDKDIIPVGSNEGGIPSPPRDGPRRAITLNEVKVVYTDGQGRDHSRANSGRRRRHLRTDRFEGRAARRHRSYRSQYGRGSSTPRQGVKVRPSSKSGASTTRARANGDETKNQEGRAQSRPPFFRTNAHWCENAIVLRQELRRNARSICPKITSMAFREARRICYATARLWAAVDSNLGGPYPGGPRL